MTKIYLSEDAVVRTRLDGEHDHLGMAKTVLGAAWTPGDTAEAIEANYRAMWDAGWVRVIDTPTALYGEKWLNGEPVPVTNLPRVQREWLEENSALVGKQLYWNAKVFESTREGQSNAVHAAQVLTAGQTLSDMQRIYLSEDGVARMLTGDERDHTDMARTILGGAAKDARTDFDLYCLMWNAGWVRVVSTPDKLYGEKILSRRQATFMSLPKAQRHWLEDNSALVGKQFIWNDAVFESTREGGSNASRAAQVLMADGRESANREPSRPTKTPEQI